MERVGNLRQKIPLVLAAFINYNNRVRGFDMKRFIPAFVIVSMLSFPVGAYQLQSNRELGKDDAKNQNVVVKCTTDTGKVSNQTCGLRRYARCTTNTSGKKTCNGWQQWTDVRNPAAPPHPDWQSAAAACCKAKGLR